MTDPAALSPDSFRIFEDLLVLVGSRGQGMTLSDLGAAHAIARELDGPEPDADRVGSLLRSLQLQPSDLAALQGETPVERVAPGETLDLFAPDPEAAA